MQMKRKMFILPFVLVALIAVTALTGCNGSNSPAGPEEVPPVPTGDVSTGPPPTEDAYAAGEGETVFRFEVTDDNGTVAVWNVHTDETTVGAALLEAGLIEGDMSDMGLMVKTVNGLRADFTEDGFWWAFYVDGEMAMAGVDSTDIEEGKVYAFVHTPA